MMEDNEYKEQGDQPKELKTGMWIHDKEEDPKYISGYKILPSCTCSRCGYHSNREKVICPQCGTKMKV